MKGCNLHVAYCRNCTQYIRDTFGLLIYFLAATKENSVIFKLRVGNSVGAVVAQVPRPGSVPQPASG